MQPAVRVCVDWPLPLDAKLGAAERAASERWDNIPLASPQTNAAPAEFQASMAILTAQRWEIGRRLRVGFVGGDKWQHDAVRAIAREWGEYANLTLDFAQGAEQAPDLRVAFASSSGSWSRLGTDALSTPENEPTMNLGWVNPSEPDTSVRGVILHEFGHALAAVHEHQNPVAGIRWNEPVVLAYYRGPPNHWSDDQTRFNLFRTYSQDATKFSAFDRTSIMIYAIPAAHTLDGFHVEPTHELSDGDRAFIGRIYPQQQPIRQIGIDGRPVQGESKVELEEDQYEVTVDKPGRYVLQTDGPTNVRMAIYGPDQRTRLIADDNDSGHDGYNARVEVLLIPGKYWVRIRHESDLAGPYSVQARLVRPG